MRGRGESCRATVEAKTCQKQESGQVKDAGCGVTQAWTTSLALPSLCVTLGKLTTLSEPQSSHLSNGYTNGSSFSCLFLGRIQ